MNSLVCAHCFLPCNQKEQIHAGGHLFCCMGCASVFDILHNQGLDAFYAIRQGLDASLVPAKVLGDSFSAYDDVSFAKTHVKSLDDGRCVVTWYVPAIHCGACVWLLERLSNKVNGLEHVTVNMTERTAHVRWDKTHISLSEIARWFDRLGYAPYPLEHSERLRADAIEERGLFVDMGIAGALAGNAMLIAFVLWDESFVREGGSMLLFFRLLSGSLAALSLFIPGRRFLRGGYQAVRMMRSHMDVPIALGLIAGFALSIIETIQHGPHVYFDTISGLVFFLLIGRWLYHRQARIARGATEVIDLLLPRRVMVVRDDHTIHEISRFDLEVGMHVQIQTGMEIPADGIVLQGEAHVNQAMLTGESRPIHIKAGLHVLAGTFLVDGTLVIRVLACGEATRMGELLRRIRLSQTDRTHQMIWADRVSGSFIAFIVLLSLIAWKTDGFVTALTLLIVACPCALAMATPLVVTRAIARAAAAGILVKRGRVFELLAQKNLTFVFDKTGTLTKASRRVVACEGDKKWIDLAVGMAQSSSHPVAIAIANLKKLWVKNIVAHEIKGMGLEWTQGNDTFRLGQPMWATQDISTSLQNFIQAQALQQRTPLLLGRNGQAVLAFAIDDMLVDGVADVLQWLRQKGHQTWLLSGDSPVLVQALGEQLGFLRSQCQGGVDPDSKRERIQSLRDAGHVVVMVGDGMNDAAALADADVGIAVAGGVAASLDAADVYLQPGVMALPNLLAGSLSALRRTHATFIYALIYNLFAVGLAWTGSITPLLAAVIMPISSLSVVAFSYLARYPMFFSKGRT